MEKDETSNPQQSNEFSASIKSLHDKVDKLISAGKSAPDALTELNLSEVESPKEVFKYLKRYCSRIQKFISNNANELEENAESIKIVLGYIYIFISGIWQCCLVPSEEKKADQKENNNKGNSKEMKNNLEEYALAALSAMTKVAIQLGGNHDLLWLIIPIHRLLFELIQTISYCIVKTETFLEQGTLKPALEPIISDLKSLPEKIVFSRLTKMIALSLEKLLVDHKKEIASSAGLILVGAVTSIATMKVSESLLTGLWRAACATFDIFQHYKANQQIEMLQVLVPSRPIGQALITYEDLAKASKNAEVIKGNWLLVSAYINNLLKVVYCASQNLKPQTDTNEEENKKILKILNACIYGDHRVAGIIKFYKKSTKPKKCDTQNVKLSNILNATSLSGLLKDAAVEAFGEIMENLELFVGGSGCKTIDEQVNSFLNQTITTFEKELNIVIGSIEKGEEMEKCLHSLNEVIALLKWFQDGINRLSKCLSRIQVGINAIWNLCNAINCFFQMFDKGTSLADIDGSHDGVKLFTSNSENIFEDVWNFVSVTLSDSDNENPISIIRKLRCILFILTWCFGTISHKLLGTQNKIFQTSKTFSSAVVLNDWQSLNNDIQHLEDYYKQLKSKIEGKNKAASWYFPSTPFFEVKLTAKELKQIFDNFKIIIGKNLLGSAIIQYELPKKHITEFQPLLSLLGKTSNVVTVVIGFADKCCDLFDEVSPLAERPVLGREEKSFLYDLSEEVQQTIGGYLSQDFGSWWSTLSETWSTCMSLSKDASKSGAFNMIREGISTLVGPGGHPELIEEASVSTIIEFETILSKGKKVETDETDAKNKKTRNDTYFDVNYEIMKLIQTLQNLIGKSTAASGTENVAKLLEQSSYRTKAIAFLQKHWPSVEDELVSEINIGKQSQQDFHDATHQQTDKLSKSTRFIAFAKEAIVNDALIRKVNTAIKATGEVAEKKGGVSGVATQLRFQLLSDKKEIELRQVVMLQNLEKAEAKAKFNDPYFGQSNHDEFLEILKKMEKMEGMISQLTSNERNMQYQNRVMEEILYKISVLEENVSFLLSQEGEYPSPNNVLASAYPTVANKEIQYVIHQVNQLHRNIDKLGRDDVPEISDRIGKLESTINKLLQSDQMRCQCPCHYFDDGNEKRQEERHPAQPPGGSRPSPNRLSPRAERASRFNASSFSEPNADLVDLRDYEFKPSTAGSTFSKGPRFLTPEEEVRYLYYALSDLQ